MSAPTPRAVFSAVSDLEAEVRQVQHFSLAIMAMGYGPHLLDPNAVYVVGNALEALAKRLQTAYDFAFEQAKEAVR